jgi:Domain of unknown function (DUF6702)
MVVHALAFLVALAGFTPRADFHPLHTTLAELSIASDGGVEIVMRVFLDDFSAAVAGRAGPASTPIATPQDSSTARYLGQTVLLTDGTGQRVPLVITNVRRTDDLLWITLRAPSVRSVVGARLTNRVLFDRWDDQVNIVQTSVGGRRQTLLFTKRDGNSAKAI